jgi:putative redox protein
MSLVKTAIATWDGNLCFNTTCGSGHTVRMDGKGNITGFSPMELILVGLAGCTGMDVIDILRKKRQDVANLVVNVRGTQSDEHPKVYTHIEIEYVVSGRDIDPHAVDRAISLSQTKYCPASAMLGKGATIQCSYRIETGQSQTESAPA